MAKDETKEKTPTEYRVLAKQEDGTIKVPNANGEDGELAVEVYALLPETYTGNVVRQAAEKYGEGSYAPVPVSSFKIKTAIKPEPKFKIS